MTIASDFYTWLDNDHRTPGTEGRRIHNRIAELEETHTTLQRELLDVTRESVSELKAYGVLQYEHIQLLKDHVALQERYVALAERTGPTVSLDDIKRESEG